jgi:transporter family protein
VNTSATWFYWALLSAAFAALTAVFAKVGIRDVDSDLATLIRTAVIIIVLSGFVWFTGKWSNPLTLSLKTCVFLSLSALATGASWVCYFRALQIGKPRKSQRWTSSALFSSQSSPSRFLANGQRLASGSVSCW